MEFSDFVIQATGGAGPRDYQARLAAQGLPEALCMPTGAGKTLAAVLPWLWRRHRGLESTTRLVLVLPQRVLVEQTVAAIRGWLANLGEPVAVHVLMGGSERDDREWKTRPHATQIFVGTQDLVLSRLLMRGYAEGRAAWPMSFGVLHTGTQFVFDETQLMGPGLGTSLQLEAFRRAFGTTAGSRSMWMSATLGPLRTVDFTPSGEVVELSEADRVGEFARVLDTRRRFAELPVDGERYAGAVAEEVLARHQRGTRTLVVLNTVARAKDVYRSLEGRHGNVVLVHAQFRPPEREAITARITAERAADQIVVSTQVLEAGVDITSRTLITELAPWTSIVQRAGRCNRYGECEEDGADGDVLWVTPPGKNTAPYEQSDVDATAEQLRAMEGQAFTGEQLAAVNVRQTSPLYQLLRRHRLLELFDTTADLAGDDIDVGPYIRDAEDRTVFVAWRHFTGDEPALRRAELCPVPVGAARALAKQRHLRVYNQQAGGWTVAGEDDVRPTARLAMLAGAGGYSETVGFDPRSRTPVTPVSVDDGPEPEDGMDADPGTVAADGWYPLDAHAMDTEKALDQLIEGLDLDTGVVEALRCAARFHDLGKHHPTFQDALRKANPENPPEHDHLVFAKSPGRGRLPFDPPHFRHELASALLLRTGDFLDGVAERDLAVYLALAHHGKLRVSVRPHAREREGVARGVQDRGTVTVDGVEYRLDLEAIGLGDGSFTAAALALLDREDVGPFRLAYYESLVRAADWIASERVATNGGPA